MFLDFSPYLPDPATPITVMTSFSSPELLRPSSYLYLIPSPATYFIYQHRSFITLSECCSCHVAFCNCFWASVLCACLFACLNFSLSHSCNSVGLIQKLLELATYDGELSFLFIIKSLNYPCLPLVCIWVLSCCLTHTTMTHNSVSH